MGYELMALACGLSFLSKGVVGPALILGPVVMVLVARRDFGEFKRALPQAGVGLLVFLAVVLPWVVNLNTVGGRLAIDEYLVQNTLGRIAPSAIGNYTGGHEHPFYYYFLEFPQHFLPWILAFPAALMFLIHPPETLDKNRQRALVTAILLFAGGFLLLSMAATKRGVYLVPIYPLMAVVVGGWFAHACDPKTALTRLERVSLQVFSVLLALVPLAIVLGTTVVALTGIGPKNYDMTPVVRTLRPLLAGIIPVGLGAFFYLGKKALRAVRTKTAPSCVFLFASAVILVIAYNEGAVRVMDPVKSIHRFTAKMKPHVKDDSVLAGYQVNEAVRAMIPFDTGRYIRTFEDPAGLARFLETHPTALVVTLERRVKDLPAALRNRLKLITEQAYSRSFKVQLYENSTFY